MKLDIRDVKEVEAVAKARIGKVEGRKPVYWAIGVAIIEGGAYFLLPINQTVAIILGLAGVGVYYWYMSTLDSKIKVVKHQLLKEWNQEIKNG